MARWHVEHRDGRRWGQEELDGLALRLKLETRMAPYVACCQSLCIDPEGEVVVLDGWGEWFYVGDLEPDMVVVPGA